MPPQPTKQQPIRWTKHDVAVPPGHALRMLAAADVPPDSPTVPIELPELPDDANVVEVTKFLLRRAAEVEHALLVQYLYAAYSLRVPRPDVIGIAIEEMAHLMTVQNLLLLLGAPPHLSRQDLESPGGDLYRLSPFPLVLEPLSRDSLAKYVIAESPENAETIDPVVATIRKLASEAVGGQSLNRVGTLYAFLGVVFGEERLLMERAAEGDLWFQMVYKLASVAAKLYGRKRIHLPNTAFQPETVNRHGTEADWDRSASSLQKGFRVPPVTNRVQALEALRDIGIQGEGPSQPDVEQSHFARFLDVFKKLFGDGSGIPEDPVFRVPRGAVIPLGDATNPNSITHPETMKWARLADLRYALLLGFLEQFLVSAPNDRQFLRGWVFAEMYHLKFLGAHLVSLPRSASVAGAEAAAAVPFNVPPSEQLDLANSAGVGKWPAVHAKRLQEAFELGSALLPTLSPSTDPWLFITHLVESDRRKLAEAKARTNGQSVRTRFDQVREILDWAAGTGSPKHWGTSPATGEGDVWQRRFWQLSLDHFKQTVIGMSIIDPAGGPGSDPYIINQLKTTMPRGRPKLDSKGPEIAFILQWIKDGCPDTPLATPAPPPPNS